MSTAFGYAQKINFQKYSVKDGLPQSTVKEIEQDNYGNLWLATQYGLSRFNGRDFENYTINSGLPSNVISSLLFARENLFIGTQGGLCVFNGSKIIQNDLLKKITGSVVKILEKEAFIHVITSKGYYIIDVSNKDSYKLDSIPIPNITANNPSDATFDPDGNLWISSTQKGLFFVEINPSVSIPKLILIQNSIASTKINKKLIRIVNFNNSTFLKSNTINSLLFDNQKQLLFSDWTNGIARINFNNLLTNGVFEAEYINIDTTNYGIIQASRINKLSKDKEGNLYIATDGSGYVKVLIDKFTNELHFNKENIIAYNTSQGGFITNPLCFKQDENKNTWIGTLNDGLILLNDNSSLSYNQKSGLEEEKVISVHNSSDSSIWLGTYGGGAFQFKNKKFTRCFWDQGISESIIKSINEDNWGNIWLGTTGGGINIIGKNNIEKQHLHVTKAISSINGLASNYLSYLFKDAEGNMWVGYQGLAQIDKITINADLSYKITPFEITRTTGFNTSCITEDDEKNVWITSNDGLFILNTKTGNVNSQYKNIKSAQSVVKDWNGNMWVATSDAGVSIFKNKSHIRYFEKGDLNNEEKINSTNGISSNCVNSILFEKNKIWLITNDGINEVGFDSYLNKITGIKNLNKGSNFASYDNKPNSAVFDVNNDIWIGSVEGLTVFKNHSSEDSLTNKREVIAYITSLKIDNKTIDWTNETLFSSGEYASIKFNRFFNWYKIPNDLELDYKHNSIQVTLNTNNIADQKLINYEYKLIGYDKDWILLLNSNEITYRNLPAGDYSLLIKASPSSDFEKSKLVIYNFSINPPFWKAMWFWVVLGIGGLGGLYYLISSREQRLKREKLKLELLVKSRTSEIENQKREIEIQSGLIQDINNDLTDSIKYAQRIQQTILPNTEKLKDYFSDYFVYYKPRNIVSGDYYWMKELNDLVYIAVVDCTGHGVPGAFMSLISSSILNEAVNPAISKYQPVKMLRFLRKEINARLSLTSGERINDGLDISLICYDKAKGTLEYVNANRPMIVISNNELSIIPAEKVTIGGFADFVSMIPSQIINVKPGDSVYIFTDGVTDQFGGPNNKKYSPKRLRELLLANTDLPMNELRQSLSDGLSNWQGKYEQTDDILMIGLKV